MAPPFLSRKVHDNLGAGIPEGLAGIEPIKATAAAQSFDSVDSSRQGSEPRYLQDAWPSLPSHSCHHHAGGVYAPASVNPCLRNSCQTHSLHNSASSPRWHGEIGSSCPLCGTSSSGAGHGDLSSGCRHRDSGIGPCDRTPNHRPCPL